MHHILLTYTSPIIYTSLCYTSLWKHIKSYLLTHFFCYFLRDDFPQDLILKKQLALPGTIKALPGGSRITGLGPPGAEGPVQEMWKKNRSAGKIYHSWRWVQHIHSNTQLCFAANIQPPFIATSLLVLNFAVWFVFKKLLTTCDHPVKEAPSFTDLRKVQLPTTVFLCVEAIRPGKLPCCAMLSPDPAGQRGLVRS